MANPLEQIIALAKKGDRRVLIGGAVVVGGGVGLAVYLKNRNGGGVGAGSSGGAGGAGGMGSPDMGNPQAALAGSSDATSGGGGGGGLSDSPVGNDTAGAALPTLPDLSSQTTAQSGGDQGLPGLPDLTAAPIGNYGFGTSDFQPLPNVPSLQPQSYAGDQSYGNDLGSLPTLPAGSSTLNDVSAPSLSGASQPIPVASLANPQTSPVFPANQPMAQPVNLGSLSTIGSAASKAASFAAAEPTALPPALSVLNTQLQQQQQIQSAYAQNLRLQETAAAEFAQQAARGLQQQQQQIANAYQQNNNLFQSQFQSGRIPVNHFNFPGGEGDTSAFNFPGGTGYTQSQSGALAAIRGVSYGINPAYSQNAALSQTVAQEFAPQAGQIASAYQQNQNLASSMQQAGRIPQQQVAAQISQAAAGIGQAASKSHTNKLAV